MDRLHANAYHGEDHEDRMKGLSATKTTTTDEEESDAG